VALVKGPIVIAVALVVGCVALPVSRAHAQCDLVPVLDAVSPSTVAMGMYVTLSGHGFGASQGTSTVSLGGVLGAVVEWSDVRIVATVEPRAESGVAQIVRNGVPSNALPLTVAPPVYVPLFRFAAFFAGDLEVLPGPSMRLAGPIHTNGALYLDSKVLCTGNPCVGGLMIADAPPSVTAVSVTAAGDVVRGRKDGPECSGTVQIAKAIDADQDGALDPQEMPCGGVESSEQLAAWLGSVRSHVPPVTVAPVAVLQRGGAYWNAADLRIGLDLSSPDGVGRFAVRAYDADGSVNGARNAALHTFMIAKPGRIFYTDVPLAGKQNATTICSSPPVNAFCHRQSYVPSFATTAQVYACPRADLIAYAGCAATVQNEPLTTGGVTARRGGFYDNREHAWVYLLNVNLHDLLAWNRAQNSGARLFDPDVTSNGGLVIYLTVIGPGSTGAIPNPRYGVRVFGTSDLDYPPPAGDPTGVTAVSDQAFYVEGSYNVGTAAHPKMPAAIMADTVHVLSANWSGGTTWAHGLPGCRNDCQSFQTLTARPAASTFINAAFLSGVDVTTPGNYNGGFESYPRLHEDWTATVLGYRGSFLSLGTPTRANGAWCGTGAACNTYNPPTRDWDYDPAFQLTENLPPLTPWGITTQ
jgi:hypothetical protein